MRQHHKNISLIPLRINRKVESSPSDQQQSQFSSRLVFSPQRLKKSISEGADQKV